MSRITTEEAREYAAMTFVDPDIFPIRLAAGFVAQAEQIAAVLALHSRVVLGECVVCLETAPCPTVRALGVTA